MTTTALLGQVKARLAAATPGPWVVDTGGFDTIAQVCSEDWAIHDGHIDIGDAQLIAHAPIDLARLLAIVEVMQAAIEQSIARSDDYGDSHCSQPIRRALLAADKLASDE